MLVEFFIGFFLGLVLVVDNEVVWSRERNDGSVHGNKIGKFLKSIIQKELIWGKIEVRVDWGVFVGRV